MKLLLNFELREQRVPIDYRVPIQSFIKKSLSAVDTSFYEELYSKNTPKDFSFCVYLSTPIFEQDRILLKDNRLLVTFTMYGREMFIRFYNSLLKQKYIEFPLVQGNSMKLISLNIQQEPIITDSAVDVKMLSPLLVRCHNKETNKDIYMDCTHPDFESTLVNSIKVQSLKSLQKDYTEGLRIIPIKPVKTVIKTRGEKLNANLGTFRIIGHPVLIDYMLQASIGSKKSQGFGYLSLIGQGGGTEIER